MDATTLKRSSVRNINAVLKQRTSYVRKSNGVDDLAVVKTPKSQGVRPLDTQSRLQNGNRNDKVGGQDDVVLPVNIKTVRRELLAEDVELTQCQLGNLDQQGGMVSWNLRCSRHLQATHG